MNRNLSRDHTLMVWETLQAWLNQDTAGQALLARFQTDQSGAAGALAEWLQSHSMGMPPQLATYVSGGQVEKLINIAQAGIVLIQPTPSPTPPQDVWNVPYRQNPFFTGREEVLNRLHEHFTQAKTAALTQPPAITGLGGIGKTQIAVEYAYRHKAAYHYVLWVTAATRDTLIASFLDLAHRLNLPEKGEQDQNITVQAVQRWLEQHDHWLLIVDNADDLALAEEFLPIGGKGHILLTTRAQALGALAEGINVEKMDTEEGMLLLLRRAKVLARDTPLAQALTADRAAAESIVKEMDGLPLALDQAGAYIEETHCDVSAYLASYRQRQAELLKRRGGTGKEYPEPVATTWSLSFEQVERLNPMATDLLLVCAFLAPDAIPEELLLEGASELGTRIQPLTTDATRINDAIGILLCYSLMKRDLQEHTLSIHRLVQAVLKDAMNEATQRTWTERAVRAVNIAFPAVEFITWQRCERYLPHALVCARMIDQEHLTLLDAASLLYHVGWYLDDRARYSEAEPLYQCALSIYEQQLGPQHPDIASTLNNLALNYKTQGKYEQAEPLYERALAIREQQLGPQHPDTAISLYNLGMLYYAQGKYEQAEPLYECALLANEQQLGPQHPDTARSLSGLAELYRMQGKYEQAEPLGVRALAIREQQLGPQHPDTAISLNNLALLYQDQGKYEQAEPLYERALAIDEKAYGPEHPEVAPELFNLGMLYHVQGKYEQAEPLYERALAIREQQLGPQHPSTAQSLNNLAGLYREQGKYEQAELLGVRALAIREQQLGPQHPSTAASLNNLALLYQDQGKYEQAEPLYERALAIREQQLGPQHPDTAISLYNLAGLYREQGKYAEAEPLLKRALAIREQQLGLQHPDTVTVRENYHALVRDIKRKGKGQH